MQGKESVMFGADRKIHPSGSLLAEARDAKQWPSDWFFYPYLTTMKNSSNLKLENCGLTIAWCRRNREQCRPWSECSFWSSLIWVGIVCLVLSVPVLRTFAVYHSVMFRVFPECSISIVGLSMLPSCIIWMLAILYHIIHWIHKFTFAIMFLTHRNGNRTENRSRSDKMFSYNLRDVVGKPVSAICKKQRRRSACASAQSDQCLCCSLLT